ncbi:golgin subfamily A member 7 isoform X1 [Sus scrofa]|uniref:golgin subfamily A member 7 isoform X1 n=1 Tax=Sus scrofa TaxID=9823 RepID=UPI000A2B8337|nr:golgin subfamily A member 7 isoform X1 [Sus scrofa]XP_020933201.1 golgin subfamily A member 7 isoform X1 [Sus scrofa]XP_020933202.1 golgin subfamily A member 7 isoform X1 [Sus scrofa]
MRPQQAPVSGKVFIQRDYSSGTRCQFQTKFPAELENRIDRQQFEETVRTLNNLYAEAEKLGGQSYLEGCLACLTAYTIFLCMETHYEKVLKKVSKYIQEQNEKIYAPQGLLLTDPIERGLRVVSFQSRPQGHIIPGLPADGHFSSFIILCSSGSQTFRTHEPSPKKNLLIISGHFEPLSSSPPWVLS